METIELPIQTKKKKSESLKEVFFLIPGREVLGLDLVFKEMEKRARLPVLCPSLSEFNPADITYGAKWVFCFGSTPMEFRRLKEWLDLINSWGISADQLCVLVGLPDEKGHDLAWSWEEELGVPIHVFRLSMARYSKWELRGEPEGGPLPPKVRKALNDFISHKILPSSAAKGFSRAAELEKEASEVLKKSIWDRAQKGNAGGFSWGQAIQEEAREVFRENKFAELRPASRDRVVRKMLRYFSDLGPMTPLMKDEAVAEIMVNGCSQIYFEKQGRIQAHEESFLNDDHLKWVIEKLVRASGRRVDFSSPLCDFRLPNGARANVVLPPVSFQGPVVTIRKFQQTIHSMENLLDLKTITPAQAENLVRLVTERKNIVVAGNSGAGKTTLLNILSGYIANEERVISVEDTAELTLQRPHVVRLEVRRANSEGKGEISLSDLVVNALRMRPDRLVIGEVRGPEVVPMIQALNTGHRGSLTTVHANSSEDALVRLETLALLGAPQWPAEAVRKLIGSAFDAVVFIRREGDKRTVTNILELQGEFI